MFGFEIDELKLVKRTSYGVFTIWSKMGNRGNRWLNEEVNVKLTSWQQVRFGQLFHIHLVSYSKPFNGLLTDRVLPQHHLIFLRNVEKQMYVSIIQ